MPQVQFFDVSAGAPRGIDSDGSIANFSIGCQRGMDPLGDQGLKGGRIQAAASQLLETERHDAFGGQQQRYLRVVAAHDRGRPLVEIPDASVADLGFLESPIVE